MLSGSRTKKTVLVVSNDVAVLVLMRGMLQADYRVLLAAGTDQAVRLMMIDGMQVDLAVVDGDVRTSGWRQQVTAIAPELRILSMATVVEDGVIRVQALGPSGERISDSLLQRIHTALAVDNVSGNRGSSLNQESKVAPTAPKVMVAGRA